MAFDTTFAGNRYVACGMQPSTVCASTSYVAISAAVLTEDKELDGGGAEEWDQEPVVMIYLVRGSAVWAEHELSKRGDTHRNGP